MVLQVDLADGLPFVLAESTQIFQILMNLVGNAAEASAESDAGRILIRTWAVSVDADAVKAGPWIIAPAPGRYAVMEVTDAGTGMSPEVLARCFEPFYTTKFSGRGLGLAAVMGILRSHGGGLKVRSEPGRGSSFTIFLPTLGEGEGS
jgi:signal transduction histidine kinase